MTEIEDKPRLLFQVKIRDLSYLRDKGFLSKQGKEWLESLLEIDKDYDTNVECEQ